MKELLKIIGVIKKDDKKTSIPSNGMGPHPDPEKYEQYLMSPWFNDEERKKILKQRGVIR